MTSIISLQGSRPSVVSLVGLPPWGSADQWGNGPAPNGYRWDFVTYSRSLVTYRGNPVVTLVKAS